MKVHPVSHHPPAPADAMRDASTREDAALVAACRAGDASAWSSLYDAHFSFVYRVVRRLGVPEAEAEDLVQEVFLVAFRKLGSFQEGRVSTWLYRIAANMVSDRHRRHRVRTALFALFGSAQQGRREERTPHRVAEAHEAERLCSEVLARMAPKKREVFVLFELEGLPGEEIAERVGCPLATVWTRLYHARRDFERLAQQRGLTP